VSLPSIGVQRYLCAECRAIDDRKAFTSTRAFATGLGWDAAQESREAQRYQEDYDRAKPYSKEQR
jgi:hypothetical protein